MLPLPVPELVYRAMRSRKCVQDGKVTYEAYLRRVNEPTLSISSSKQAAKGFVPRNYGIANIAVYDIRSLVNPLTQLNLDVVLDNKDHGQILGVPAYRGEQVTKAESSAAESLAGDMARMSILED
jgi:hypothetical protein